MPDPENPGQKIDSEELESWPMAVAALEEEEFRAVKAIAGDSISIVVGEEGDVRAWGSFRVRRYSRSRLLSEAALTRRSSM